MSYGQNAGFVDGKKCLPGTRQKLINEILEWVNKDSPERVLVLSGQAGMGKSAVAHTIAEIFRTQNRLGSLFCFNRSNKESVNFLFSTISRDLADGDVLWRRNLIEAIGPTAIRKSLDFVTQFNEMIAKPSKDIGTIGPVVIIIDAIDESGNRSERQTLLSLLFERSSELPKNYRLIITSRPEPDIEMRSQHPNVFLKHMAHVNLDDTLNDIRQFISHKLSTVEKILDKGLQIDWRSQPAEKSQGLFQWANLACLYIDPTVKTGLVGRSETVITGPLLSLYELYHQILNALPEFQVEGFFTMFQTIIGAIIVSQRPLTTTVLQGLFDFVIQDVQAVLEPFHTLLVGADNSTAEIRPLHTSLFDFFLSPEQTPGTPNRYYINTSDQSSFTHACLRVMNGLLCFNICGLETSHLPNEDVPNFDSRVAEAIPVHLSYACCFWAYHLEYSHLNSELLKEIRHLMHVNLLYLFEVLSLLREVEHGRVGMRILEEQVKDEDKELAAQAADAWLFGVKFGEIMTWSTPHLYLSALPFTPKHLFISKQYISQYPQLLSIDGDQSFNLRIHDSSIVKRHPSAEPWSLDFSSRGRHIATGFKNGDLWVWDHVTGKILYQWEPRKDGGASGLYKVVFSPNGNIAYCYFEYGTDIMTWNAETKTLSRIEGFRGEGSCSTAISPDGRYIVSKTESKADDAETQYALVLYDTRTHSKHYLGRPSHIFEIDSHMMFSPKGKLFGFRRDNTTCLWDTQTQTFVSSFITEDWDLKALSDNYILAHVGVSRSVSYPNMDLVEVWDIQTHTKVSWIKIELGASIGQFNFFPDEKYFLYCADETWSIWNISTGDLIIRRSHGSTIGASAISPDSKHIALSGDDRITHILPWDILVQKKIEDEKSGSLSEDDDTRRGLAMSSDYEVWLKGRYIFLLASPHWQH